MDQHTRRSTAALTGDDDMMSSDAMKERMARVRAAKERRRQTKTEEPAKAGRGPLLTDRILELLQDGEQRTYAEIAEAIGSTAKSVANSMRPLVHARKVSAIEPERPEGTRGPLPLLWQIRAPAIRKKRSPKQPVPRRPEREIVAKVARNVDRGHAVNALRERTGEHGALPLEDGLAELNDLTLRRHRLEQSLARLQDALGAVTRKQRLIIDRIALSNLSAPVEEEPEEEEIEGRMLTDEELDALDATLGEVAGNGEIAHEAIEEEPAGASADADESEGNEGDDE
jgi:DNA-binding Lrp family transcriptional regulator